MSGEKELEISNKKFFEAWKNVCKENEEYLLKISDSTSDYTNFILKKDDCIITKIAEKFGLETYTEYYHIDAVLYEQKYLFESESKNKTWGARTDFCLKRIKVAFEHENNLKTAYQEVIHLLTTDADLKILITYAKKENTKKHAEDFCEIIKSLDNYTKIILVIFGCYIKDKDKFEWVGYELKKDGPKEIFV
jgi:hypothetical protein